ncbi:MAG: sigma 54-interacting transcriptional regulator [Desulfobulbaceae bacterium]|uniref:Sigma 54-interacting transcriptional regulator n=1 Tax=Candidatus Desulfobia pelagia TaxID=2841692 RepID=A0A8J6NFS5_9BACT|nr:sigma 54-interacting transcriptional regulator [Candidatus Desulfobia pelagia]
MQDSDHTRSHILIVDDEESLRTTFKMFLEREGYGPIITASTFEEANDFIEQQDFDLIISDIIMEGSSGIDLLRRVRDLELECPMVMVTGYPNISTATDAVRLGAFDYLAKPVKKADLLRTARMALQQYALLKEKNHLEEDKQRYQQYLETIFASVHDMIVCVNPEKKIVQMNNRAVEWCSAAVPEMHVGGFIDDLPGSFDVFSNDVHRVLDQREDVHEHRVEITLAKGEHSVLRISAVPLYTNNQEKFLGTVVIFRDVSRLEALDKSGKRMYFHRLVGSSQAMQTVYTLIENVGRADISVLITGESGTGKELVAEALHAESHRKEMPLVKFDCTAIPENLMESELFGHKKGSFTGADRNREGRILQADGGTLFLDEIGDISPLMQLRLLRFLQERTFYPVGEDQPISVDVRVIAATNADLKDRVKRGVFREDLYYRLRVVDIMLPPLRDRDGDLHMLVEIFIERFSKRLNKVVTGISDQALALMQAYQWQGNIRELEHVMERACVLCADTTITIENLPEEIQFGTSGRTLATSDETGSMDGRINTGLGRQVVNLEPEEDRIIRFLKQTDGNKAKAARMLGIDRSTLYRKMKHYNLEQYID